MEDVKDTKVCQLEKVIKDQVKGVKNTATKHTATVKAKDAKIHELEKEIQDAREGDSGPYC